ncbi:MAG: BlaI/MecI/CopY family transcriptional regulator [Acidobacteriaceae bacterium]
MAERKKTSESLTPLELRIMQVLWEHGPANVQSVQDRLQDRLDGSPALAYTTIQTMLNVLHRKKKVRRTLRGRAYQYEASVTHEAASGYAVKDMLDRMFGGSVEMLLMNLVKSRQLDPKKLAQISRQLAQEEEKQQKEKEQKGKKEKSHD